MIDIRHRALSLDLFDAKCFELQVCHRARGVLRERLVDTDRNRLPRRNLAIDQMRVDDLLNQILTHRILPLLR